jgi:hypothetical protein
MGKSKGSVTITLDEIYKEIKAGNKRNAEEHAILTQHAILTNGKVRLNTWRSITALTISLTIFTAIVGFLVKVF